MLDQQPVETTLYSLDEKAPAPDRRRPEERHLSLLRVGTLMLEDRRELCLIKNVSAGGMLIRVYSPIAEGDRLTVELKQGEPVHGIACWAKDDCVGVSFDSPIDVVSLISASDDGPRPRMPRVEVQCTAWVREDGTVHRAEAVNVSQGGVRIVTRNRICVGAEVVVTLIDFPPTPGVVRWNEGDSYGITFNRPLPLATLVAWLRARQEQRRAAG